MATVRLRPTAFDVIDRRKLVEQRGYVDVDAYWDDGIDPINYRQIIARRAYDLAKHILKDIQYDHEKYIDDHVRKLSDMTEWPREEE